MGNWKEHWINYYDVLGIEFGADANLIKKKYRELARLYHPDVYKQADGDEKFKEINEAYEVLSDEKERQLYDEAYLNTLNENNKEEECTTYTEEDIQNTFSQEEIRFAEKVSLEGIIAEELDKAKRILDAKNELLYAAYNDQIDKENYFETLKMFVTSANEYLISLIELKNKAFDYDLLEEKASIEEVIRYLEDIINTMPISPNDAKFVVEKELIHQELEKRKTEEIANAHSSIEEFLRFYKEVYKKTISKIEFSEYYNVLMLNLQDAQSRLESLCPLLKMGQNENQEVLKTIGECKEYLSILPRDYESALLLGEKEFLRGKITEISSLYAEIKEKLAKILKIITRYPTNKRTSVLYHYAKEMIKDIKKEIKQYSKEEGKSENSWLYDKALDLSKEALEIFNEVLPISKKAEEVFEMKEEKEYNHDKIHFLASEAFTCINKIKALELLNQAEECIGKNDAFYDLYKNDNRLMSELIQEIQKNLDTTDQQLDKIYEVIHTIVTDFNTYNTKNPQNREYLDILWKSIHNRYEKINSIKASKDLVTMIWCLVFLSDFFLCFLKDSLFENINIFLSIITIVTTLCISAHYKLDQISKTSVEDIEKEYTIRKQYYDLKDGQYTGANNIFFRK